MASKLLIQRIVNLNHGFLKDIFYKSCRKYVSTLHVSGRNANKICAFVLPYLDFDERFDDIDGLQKEIQLRKLNMDVIEMKKAWDFYKSIETKYLTLEYRKQEISMMIMSLLNKTEKTSLDEQELVKLRLQVKMIKQDMKNVKEIQWDLDETIIEKLLKLPNKLDERTPPSTPLILQNVGKPLILENNKKNHIEIGETLDLIQYKDPMNYYLLKDAALFEFELLHFAGKMLTDNNVMRITGSDFCRSVLIEASGLNHENPADTFILENDDEPVMDIISRMHLVGGTSLSSMLGLHAKQLIKLDHLPIKYYSVGRQYTPVSNETMPSGLFSVGQASTVNIFLILKDTDSMENTIEFNKMLEIINDFYSNITNHYRVVMRSAPELLTCEKMRVSIELWSPFLEQYIEVGHLSLHGKYFSKRLLIGYETTDKVKEFASIISGTMLSVPRIIGCLLEENPDKFVIPSKILKQLSDYRTINTDN
ncbi:serine--tRNA synthetase-like protein Slimp [Polistes fuscatus]|uniref:serine--tRNA synthetase-like protein Slimp n=1 Tax=Polistes fuscatus TaxID=30207 RepID=UPI001CA81C2F|nr:serine--tRNA synthetase-like protein Slimp [Polistes fuscatus]